MRGRVSGCLARGRVTAGVGARGRRTRLSSHCDALQQAAEPTVQFALAPTVRSAVLLAG